MKYVNYKVENRIGYITLNRPQKRNALNHPFVTELKEAFMHAEKDEKVKVIVLKAAGDSFCAGADLEYLQSLQNNSFEENLQDSTHLMELFKMIYGLNKIVVAQVQGHALAGGCGLVSVCDFSFSVPEANYGYTETRIGFVPAIVMVFLIRKIGEARAKELLLTGNPIKAKEAKDFGIVNWIVEENELEVSVKEFAEKLCANNSGMSMQMTKEMIAEVQSMSLDEGLAYACRKNAEARNSEDCKKGIAAFLAKEKMTW
ncbi:MAG TPA: enoyl-CoA hydratase-related protein [Cytophagaceae bacterium]|jgi:methylglutaconyl-CoA hydratase|nr:enoyl-CoA hydratase-related protein [Cytophagaceae bacterium]